MNHIYKSIFNKALGVFTAVPEFASAHGKGSERTVVGRVAKGTAGFAASALAISVGLALTSTSAVAAGAPGIYVNNSNDPACMAFIDDIHVAPAQIIYGGSKQVILPDGFTPGTALSPDTGFNLAGRNPCVAVGGTAAENHDTQTNRTLFYNDKQLTLGGRLDVNSGIIGVGDRGTNGTGATNSIRMGTGTTLADANKKLNSISIGVDTGASDANAIAIGANTSAAGSNSSAIGLNAKATTDSSIAIGTSSEAGGPATSAALLGTKAIAIGYETKALGTSNVALGYGSVAENGHDSIAIGIKAKTSNLKSISIGAYSEASGAQSTVISNNYGSATGAVSTASGTRSQVYGAETNVSGNNSVAIGDTNTVASDRTYAMGNNINAAAGTNDSLAFGTKAGVGGANAIALGNTAKATQDNSIAQGTESATYGKNSVSIGYKSVSGLTAPTASQTNAFSVSIGNETEALDASTIAIGDKAKAKGGVDALAVGTQANAMTYKALAIGAYSQATGRQSTVIGNDIQGQPSIASGTRSQILGVQSNVSGDNSVSIGDTNNIESARTYALGNNINAAAGTPDSLAFGTRASVGGASSIALGSNTKTYTDDSISIGSFSESGGPATTGNLLGTKAIAIGYETKALATSAVALGYGATVENGHDSIAIGVKAKTSTQKSTTIGSYSEARGDQSTVIANNYDSKAGKAVSIASGARSQVYGAETTVSGNNSVAIGDTNTVTSNRTYAMGNNITTSAGAHDSLAFGTQAYVGNASAIAMGNTAKAVGKEQISIGKNAGADSANSEGNYYGVYIGSEAGRYQQGDGRNYAIGQNAGQYVKGSSNIALGTNAGKGEAGNVIDASSTIAIGRDTKASGYSGISIGTLAETTHANSIALGDRASATNGHDALAVGAFSKTTAAKAMSIGSYSTASGAQSIVIASNYADPAAPEASNRSTATAARAIVMGPESHATAEDALAIGNKNTVASARTYAIGNNINVAAGADDSLVFGTQAAVGAANTVAIGANANAAQANSVALGAGSATSAAHTGDYTLNTSYTAAGLPNAANGTVSVGSAGKERQIQNVAAGVISATSTDAINGSQLYATNNYMNNFAGGVKNVLGGDAAVDNAGNLTMSNIGGTGKGNVHEAIAAVKGVADTAVQEVESENPTALSVKKDGTKVTLTPNFITGDLVNADGTVNAPATADEGKLVSAKTVADALKANHFVVDTKGNTETGSEADAKVGSGNKVTFEAGNNLVAKQANTANGGATVKFSLKDDISLNSVTAGTGANQVVLGNDGVKVGGNTYINNDGLNANSKVISNVADGVAPTDAVNKGQLDAVKNVADSAVQSVDVATNENNLVVDNNDPKNPKLRLRKAVDLDSIKLENNVGEKSFLNSAGLTIEGGPAVTRSGINANNTKVTNVTDGDVNSTSKDAVNGSQLYNVASNVADLVGPDAKIDPATGNVTVADPTKGIGETGKGTIGDAIKAVNKAATAAKTTVKEGDNITVTPTTNTDGSTTYTVATKKDLDVTSVTAGNTTVNTNGLTITGGPSVTRGGIDAGDRVISGVKAGDVSANSKEAVNGSQLYATNTKLDGVKAKADTAVQDVKSGDENALTAVKDPNTNIVTVTPKLSGDLVDADGNITAPTTPADKGKLVTAGTVAQALANTHFVVDTKATDGELDSTSQADQKIKAGNKVTLQAGKNLKAKQTNGADGAQVEFSLKDSISLTQVTAGEGDNQVVLGNNGVQVGGNTYINKDGLNANSKVISNVADGVKPTDAVNKGQLDAVKGVADSAVKSVDVANGEQNLVVDNTDAKNPKLSLKKDLIVDSVKAGDSTLNNDGLTIAGGPSVKKDGINAGDKTITNVAPGAVTAASKDAVNGGQLYNVANNVKDLIGPDATIDPATGKVTVADPAKGIGETGKGNIGDAIKHVNDAAKAAADTAKKHTTVEQGDNIVVEESTNANGGKHYKVSTAKDLNVDSVKAGDTTVNNDGVTIAGGPSVTKAGINAGGNTITNVADGVNPNDAVNKGQLDAVKGVADSAVKSVDVANGEQNLVVDNSDPKNPKLSLKKDLTVDSVKAGDSTLNNDGLTIAGGPSVKKDGIDAADKKITNVAAGDVAENSKDAVNGGQLHSVASSVANVLGGNAAVDGNGNVTTNNIGGTGANTVHDAIAAVKDAADKAADTAKKHTTVEQGDNIVVEESTNANGGKHYKVSTAKDLNVDSVKAGDTTVNNDGVTIAGGPSVTKGGINAGGNTITNVADGVNDTDAVNKGQLDKVDTKVSNVAQNVVNVLGGDATVNGNGDITMSNIGETGKGNINDAIKSVNDLAKKAAAEKTSVKAKEGRSNVTVTEGVNAAGGHEYTVDVERSVTNAGSDYVTVTNNHDADTNTTTYTVDVSAKTKASLAKADSAVQGLTSKDGNLNFTKGANGNVEVSFNDNLNVKNVTTDRVQVANGPSMSKDGINAAGKAISNVANGNVAADSKDAVNGGQLHETAKSVADVIGGGATVKDGKVVAGQNGIGNTGQNTVHGAIAAINQNTANNFNQIRGDLRKMDRDLRGGIAGALATAGLPQAFRPGKSMVAAAASTYRGQSGLAIGVSRISDNGKVILKVTGNTNSRGDFGGTIGAGYQW